MTPTEREPFLDAVDAALLPLGFKRARSSCEWKRRLDKSDTQTIHFNFGLNSINPSMAIRFSDLQKLLPPEAGAVCHVMKMLTSLSGVKYYADEHSPSEIAKDVVTFCLPKLERLRDRDAVVASLGKHESSQWPTVSASHRIRLLPLILASLGKPQEALQWLAKFESTELQHDQIIPDFSTFCSYFRSRFSA